MPGGQRGRRRRAAVGAVVGHRQRRAQAPDLDVHALQAPHQPLHLARLVRVVRAQEVVADRAVGHGLADRHARLVGAVGLELARLALAHGLDPGAVPLAQDLLLVDRRRRERGPLGEVLLGHALRRGVAVGLLERHAGGAEAVGRHGVAVARVEEVVGVVVEVRDPALVELVLHRRAVDVVDPVDRRVGDVVVDRVRVGREEVRLGAHLVGVDEQHARVAAQQLDLAVGLGLGAREPVAVHVEAVEVAARVGLAPVRVLGRQDHDDRLVEDPLGGAVGAVGELVEHAQRRVGAALLAAVHVGGDPQDRRVRGGDLRRLASRSCAGP